MENQKEIERKILELSDEIDTRKKEIKKLKKILKSIPSKFKQMEMEF